jgi:REP element-mobilizing transposase RayT
MPPEHPRPYNPDGPIAYFISFHCYETWFHGDPCGSTYRSGDNRWLEPKIKCFPGLAGHEQAGISHPPAALSGKARFHVEETIRTTCALRAWHVHAVNAQPDHVHTAISAGCKPEKVMNALKPWATRRLREASLVEPERKVWSRHGSTRWIWNEVPLAGVCACIVDGQPWPKECGEPPV